METSSDMSQGKSKSGRTEIRSADEAIKHSEGPIARRLEDQTARLPSDVFLWGALGSMGLSALMMIRGKKSTANFIGQWAPTILILGLYNKIVKVAGSDRLTSGLSRFGEDAVH